MGEIKGKEGYVRTRVPRQLQNGGTGWTHVWKRVAGSANPAVKPTPTATTSPGSNQPNPATSPDYANLARKVPRKVPEAEQAEFFDAYVKAVLWANVVVDDGADESVAWEPDQVEDESYAALKHDAETFLTENYALVQEAIRVQPGYTFGQAGHDYAITRSGHGDGFWDRGLGDVGEELTAVAQASGEFTLFANDDGTLWMF